MFYSYWLDIVLLILWKFSSHIKSCIMLLTTNLK